MTPGRGDFDAFSERLEREDVRTRMRRALEAAGVEEMEDPAAVSHALEVADPLGDEPHERWRPALRTVLAAWPGRVAVATALAAAVIAGVAVGRLTIRTPPPAAVTAGVPLLPAWQPRSDPGLALQAGTRPESTRKFREAMSRYGQPDFAETALPLLREAVAADAGNDEAQFWLGVLVLRQGRAAEAVAPLEAAARLAPADRVYRGYLLYAYLESGAVERARTLQRELLQR